MKTTFERVIDFNKSFGVRTFDKPQPNIFTENPKLVKLRLSLIIEEVNELKEAIENHDFVEVIDALGDIKYVVDGAAASFGIDLDKAFDLIHISNMSKLCKTEDEAKETVEWYLKNDKRYDTPSYRKSENEEYYVVFNESTGKILKSINYDPVKFDSLLSK